MHAIRTKHCQFPTLPIPHTANSPSGPRKDGTAVRDLVTVA